ncbi:MAG: VIT family protein [Sulfitobacter sp.]|nr:VIT family protein [Sulfitobacter sp.]
MVEEAHDQKHYSGRSGWLRAAVLGANDGLLSTSSLIVGVAAAAAATSSSQIVLAGVAGLVAGAMSMAAGEYVSVSSQSDTEKADIALEKAELVRNPGGELEELREILISRGMSRATAIKAADEMTAYDAIGTHVREEIGLSEVNSANPIQAGLASAVAFIVGGLPPVVVSLVSPSGILAYLVAITTVAMLLMLGAAGAKLGGAPMGKAALRVAFWGVIAMTVTHIVGSMIGAQI